MQKNKTVAATLAFLLGGAGAHRFYLYGKKDLWGWLHAATLAISAVAYASLPNVDPYFTLLPLQLSILAGFIAALVLGLTPDAKWDVQHANPTPSETRWPLAVVLVADLMVGATGLIWLIARLFDLLFTGGAYG